MAVAFRSVSQGADGNFTADASPAINAPAGVQDGDLLLYAVVTDSDHTIANVPTGWTQVGTTQAIAVTDSCLSVFWRIAASEGASYTFSTPGDLFSTVESGRGIMLAYSGAHQVSPINTTNQSANANAASHTSAEITPSVNDCMIVAFFGADSPDTQAGTASGDPTPTERADVVNSTLGWAYAEEYLQGTAAAVDLSVDVAATDSAGNIILAIAPAAAGTPVTIEPGLGSAPLTGRTMSLDFAINMPDTP
jgi:hypothetical protein